MILFFIATKHFKLKQSREILFRTLPVSALKVRSGQAGNTEKICTVVGNDNDGYYLFSDLAPQATICYGKGLDKYERAYCNVYFKEENRFFSDRTPGFILIDNARIEIITAYNVIRPISKEEAERHHITYTDSCSVAPSFSLNHSIGASNGYFDFETPATLSYAHPTYNEYIPIPMDMIYDPERQSPDTLRLELNYRPRIPEGWTTDWKYEDETSSCDISALSDLQQWNDSLSW